MRRPGALARALLFPAVRVGADGWGGGVGRAPAPLSGGGRGAHPPCLGGLGPWPPRLAGRWGGVGGGGAPRGLPAPPLGGGPRVATLAFLLSSAHSPPACACGRGRGAAPGWGGMRGGPCTAPLGAPADLNLPSALPEWAVVMGGSWGARPPYCFGARSALCSGALVWARLSAATPAAAGRWGRWGARCAGPAASPPPPRRGPFWGRGGVPSAPGGRRVAPMALKLGGGAGGGAGGAAPPPPALSHAGLPSVVSRVPPRGILVPWGLLGGRGRRARSGRPPTGQCGGGGGGGGRGGGPLQPWFGPLSSPGRLRRPGRRRSAVGRLRAGRAGACLVRGAPSPWVQRPLPGGCGAAVSLVCPRPLLGLRGRGGGVGGAPWSPGAAP